MKRRAWALTMAVGLAACGGSNVKAPAAAPTEEGVSAATVPAPPAAEATESVEGWVAEQREASEAPLSGYGVSDESADDAKLLALLALDEAFWEDSQWPSLPAGRTSLDTTRPNVFGAVQVSETEIEGQFAAFATTVLEPIPELTQRWLDETAARLPEPGTGFMEELDGVLHQAWWRAAQGQICARLSQFSLGEPCEALPLSEQEAEMQRLADGLILESVFADGIPLDLSGKPTRPLEILVTWTDGSTDAQPVRGIPIAIREGAEWFEAPEQDEPSGKEEAGELETESSEDAAPAVQRESGEDGVARFDFTRKPTDEQRRMGVALDRNALLGSFGESFPELVLSVPFRRVSPEDARIALAVRERWAEGETAHLVNALREELSKSRQAILLGDEESAVLADGVTPDALDTLARLTRGRIDVVVSGDATSQLTSRMGSRSVYHEASTNLTVYDVWSGAPLATVEDSVQALGLGEARAARNALSKLGEALAAKINSALKRPVAAR